MTLIVAAGNEDQFVQVSDRRLSNNGHISDDESNKAIVFNCANARLAVGYTGIAEFGTFKTKDWLLEGLNKCALPDYTAENSLKRFTEKASLDFGRLPELKNLNPIHKKLSIMFTGYLYHHSPPLGALAVVSNFQDMDKNAVYNQAQHEFKVFFREEKRPTNGKISLFFHVGIMPPIPEDQRKLVVELVKERKPARAIENKLVEIIRILADHPLSYNTIGKQLTSIILPRDREKGAKSNYYSETVKYESFLPDQVYAVSNKLHLNVCDVSIKPLDLKTTPPMSGPKLRPNQPCWCKSGAKYKHCHGKKTGLLPWGIKVTPDE